MKKLKLLIISTLFTIVVYAQDQSGKFFVETSVHLFGAFPEFIGKTGISFIKSASREIDRKDPYDFSDCIFSWSVAPRIGYHLNGTFMTGMDLQAFHYTNKGDDHKGMSYLNYMGGLFLRIDFSGERKITPYVEFASGLGKSKEVWDATSPGGAEYQQSEKFNLIYLSGTPGFAYRLSDRLRVNFMVKFQDTIQKEPRKTGSYPRYITENYEVGPMISLQYTFISKSKKSNQE